MQSLYIAPIKAFKDNYIWAIVNQKDNTVWVVDPGDANPVLQFLQKNQLRLCGILITHHHDDHCGGVESLLQQYDVPVYGALHANIHATHTVQPGQMIALPDCALTFEVLAIPGHTLEHIAYYCAKMQWLFCGDTLFSGGCGRVFEGTFEQMYASLMILASLPDATLVYCAHEYTLANLYFAKQVEPNNVDIENHIVTIESLLEQGHPSVPSTLSLERKINPFLRGHIPAVKAAAEIYAGQALVTPVEVFAVIRQWKNAV